MSYWGASNNGPWGSGNQGYTRWMSGGPGAGTVFFGDGQIKPFNPTWAGEPQPQQQAPRPPAMNFGSLMPPVPSQQNVTTGINVRPIATDSQVNAALSKYGSMKPRVSSGPLGNTAQQLYSQQAQGARVAADRDMSAANEKFNLASATANSGAGLGWANLGNRNQYLADNQNVYNQQTALSLLRALGVV